MNMSGGSIARLNQGIKTLDANSRASESQGSVGTLGEDRNERNIKRLHFRDGRYYSVFQRWFPEIFEFLRVYIDF